MYIDIFCYDNTLDKEKLIRTVFGITELNLSGISIPQTFYNDVRDFLTSGSVISTPIDYPFGLSEIQTKIYQTVRAKQLGFNAIDFTPNFSYINNRNYQGLRQELIAIVLACKKEGLSLRLFLDYRNLPDERLEHLCNIVADIGIEYAFTSTGMGLVSFEDSMIAAQIIQKKGIFPIVNCNIYRSEYLDTMFRAGVFGMRFDSIHITKQKFWCIK